MYQKCYVGVSKATFLFRYGVEVLSKWELPHLFAGDLLVKFFIGEKFTSRRTAKQFKPDLRFQTFVHFAL